MIFMPKYIYTFFALFIGLLFVASPALAYFLVDNQGEIVLTQGQVLNSRSEAEDEDSDDSSSDDNDSELDSNDSNDSDEQDEVDEIDGPDLDEEDEADEQKETKTESKDGAHFNVEPEDENDEDRADVYQSGVKIRLERVDDRFRIITEDKFGEEIELSEDDLVSIDERADHDRVRIRAFDSATDQLQNTAVIERLNTQALTDLPLSVDLETNELTVTTSAGERTVTVLPDQIVQNILAANIVDQIGGQELASLVRQGGIETLDQVIRLSQQSGVPVYEARGIKQHRLFGFFSVTTDVTVIVSAETGEVLDTNQSFLDSVIDVFSTTV